MGPVPNLLEEEWNVIMELGGSTLGLLPDTFHMNIEERSMEESLRKFAPYLRYIHLADSNRQAPGNGHLDFQGVLNMLDSVQFEGFFSFEILPKPNPNEAAKRAIDFTRSLKKE
jgi:sugar phosphate isomerase/epimerase